MFIYWNISQFEHSLPYGIYQLNKVYIIYHLAICHGSYNLLEHKFNIRFCVVFINGINYILYTLISLFGLIYLDKTQIEGSLSPEIHHCAELACSQKILASRKICPFKKDNHIYGYSQLSVAVSKISNI